VIEAALLHAAATGQTALIEATCNQVNQEGGYTGVTPAGFRKEVESIAQRVGFPLERLLLGGDHLGPNPWSAQDAEIAMTKAEEMVRLYVQAGFVKIHLDASMPCAGEKAPLADDVIAERAARLCAAAESVRSSNPPYYVIGTEVPTPGGALEEEPQLTVTKPEAAVNAINTHRDAFHRAGLDEVWERVIALVVQPGVEFANDHIHDFVSEEAVRLTQLLTSYPGLIYEAHSTDYQRPEAFNQLVRGGFRILKVGPALTYAMRQALYALETIEQELLPAAKRSQLRKTMEELMVKQPGSWKSHYHGSEETLRIERVHSYSDRIRYYWNAPEAQKAVDTLIENLRVVRIPETMLSDYLPLQYANIRRGELLADPVAIVIDSIREALRPYSDAVA
jgi:D-tagatose-1,6-bisphosphate aldolase subunit GatZ/KbaZ